MKTKAVWVAGLVIFGGFFWAGSPLAGGSVLHDDRIPPAIGAVESESTDATEAVGGRVVRIDPARRFQTIEGFGTSGAWWPNYVAEFPEEDRQRLLRLLFTDAGADLSMYRYNIPAGDGEEITRPMRRTVLIETAPRTYDFDRDWKAQRILEEVRALGVEQFVLFANSAPPRMLVNGQVSGGPNGGSNLRPDARGDFAHYLLDVTKYLKEKYDLPHITLSPINEPQWNWGRDGRRQEGCHFTPGEVAAMMRVMVDTVKERGFDIEVEAPESGDWKGAQAYAEALFADPVLAERLDVFAVHSYWSNLSDKRKFAEWFRAEYPDKSLAMTEYCQMEWGHDLSMDGGLHLANVMHDDLVEAGVVNWQWWLGVAPGGYKDGLIYAHPETRNIEPTRRLWVMGNFSRFVRPGAVRVAAESPAGDELKVSAFRSGDGETLAVILVNNGEERVIRPQVAGRSVSSLRAFVTTAADDLTPLTDATPQAVRLPARSVTTLVVSRREEL